MRRLLKHTLLLLLCFSAVATPFAHANQQLVEMVKRLQSKPYDDTLREQIIKLAVSMKPGPAIPEAARDLFIEANTIVKSAKSTSDEMLAVGKYRSALLIAPWWGDAYYNLAIAQELAGQLDDAQSSLKLFLLTKPNGSDARAAQDRIYALRAKKQLDEQHGADAQRDRDAETVFSKIRENYVAVYVCDAGGQTGCTITAATDGSNYRLVYNVSDWGSAPEMLDVTGHYPKNTPVPTERLQPTLGRLTINGIDEGPVVAFYSGGDTWPNGIPGVFYGEIKGTSVKDIQWHMLGYEHGGLDQSWSFSTAESSVNARGDIFIWFPGFSSSDDHQLVFRLTARSRP